MFTMSRARFLTIAKAQWRELVNPSMLETYSRMYCLDNAHSNSLATLYGKINIHLIESQSTLYKFSPAKFLNVFAKVAMLGTTCN